jgi:hypothetical protein
MTPLKIVAKLLVLIGTCLVTLAVHTGVSAQQAGSRQLYIKLRTELPTVSESTLQVSMDAFNAIDTGTIRAEQRDHESQGGDQAKNTGAEEASEPRMARSSHSRNCLLDMGRICPRDFDDAQGFPSQPVEDSHRAKCL